MAAAHGVRTLVASTPEVAVGAANWSGSSTGLGRRVRVFCLVEHTKCVKRVELRSRRRCRRRGAALPGSAGGCLRGVGRRRGGEEPRILRGGSEAEQEAGHRRVRWALPPGSPGGCSPATRRPQRGAQRGLGGPRASARALLGLGVLPRDDFGTGSRAPLSAAHRCGQRMCSSVGR